MSLLVFYAHHIGIGESVILFRKGDGIIVNSLHGSVVSLRTATQEDNIFTPVCVFDDSTTPPTLLLEVGCAAFGYRHLPDMPRFFIDRLGHLRRSSDGQAVMMGDE